MNRTLVLFFASLILMVLVCGCATTSPARPDALTDEDYEMCERAGGCILMPKVQLFEILKRVREKALAEAKDMT